MLAASATTLGIAAHAAAGGGLPDASVTVVVLALIGWAATSLADRARGVPATVAVLGTAQLVMHGALTVLGPHGGHHEAATTAGAVAMAAAHAAATLLTALLLTRAERGIRLVCSSLRRILPRVWQSPPPVPAAVPAGVPVLAGGFLLPAYRVHFRRICGRRGPPALP
ncbi:hypothetical protein F8178_00030 [Haloechinothrix sp. LS1_15]|nr:hypothetical protein [Haloechinothrix sp. LS1_15]